MRISERPGLSSSLVLILGLAWTCLGGLACHVGSAEIKPFTSDGCSLFPDGTLSDRTKWCDCCFTHDIAYWRGGTREERKLADGELRDCVLERTGDKGLAELMYRGVRAGGSPAFPTWYRWGYGWTYGRNYKPLTEREEQEAKDKFDEYMAEHPTGFCAELSRKRPSKE
jgi:hypothetical protein